MSRKRRRKEEEKEEYYRETFSAGRAVEVSSEDQGLRGSWYTATVIRGLSRSNNKILVEYHNLFTDDSGSNRLREYVDAVLIRPIPPIDSNRLFQLMEDVDAFHNDGWWEGVVTKHQHEHNSYSVFFRSSREQIDFSPSDLRLHREWLTANQWIPPLPTDNSPSARNNGEDGQNGGRSPPGNARLTRNAEVGRGNITSSTQQAAAGGVLLRNGGAREAMRNSNRNAAVLARKNHTVLTNGVCTKIDVTRNGTLKEPRRRAANHTGGRTSRK